ncbi:nuclear transport factor 2 family protein [bacterium]|nr:nuclear transport factor 2 family protein [bacterium]
MKILFSFDYEYFSMLKLLSIPLLILIFGTIISGSATGESPKSDAEIVASLDTEYQAAVARNDADTMDRILADDFVLVLGNGTVYTKPDLINEARAKNIVYEQQVEVDDSQKVRVWGDTAVVTAKLWVKGKRGEKSFDRKLWFSDTYVKTPNGWKYVFGQASLALPNES